ncbi:hypothetical protein, variant [Sphaeroforma arctica JP610]|uniref:Uncharacterized protein n=1 Tax=Sphaeroforma arctica JP610 TaxID=667725 RepID=A0A0L0G7B3_9EUKA|nr:hypothetical protein, variant [Sphaeroforma arctica JP610]KNC84932.1 hypothetical protein, variant [Sphaeroforma arctica JP610]|eukprot:XP_014158834.1 hypothetical protein, variant [Sphaeroforma arctica JP610]
MSLFIGRLSHDIREADLEDVFIKYGKINRCEVKNGGFAFVDYEDKRDAEDAMKAEDGREIRGARIAVEWAKGPKTKNDDCFKCGRGGHWARECPNSGGGRYDDFGRGGGRGDKYGGGRYGDDRRGGYSRRSPSPYRRRRSPSPRRPRSRSPIRRGGSRSPPPRRSRTPRRSSRSPARGRSPSPGGRDAPLPRDSRSPPRRESARRDSRSRSPRRD